jgi:hypothetical protein
LYASAQAAAAAVDTVKAEGFTSDLISVVSESAGSQDAIAAAIAAAFVLKNEAKIYAQGVKAGRTLVIVRAPFCTGGQVEKLLDSAGPIDSGYQDPIIRSNVWDEAAPLSSALGGIPTILKSGLPLSRMFGMRTITKDPSFSLFGNGVISSSTYKPILPFPLLKK